MMVEKSDRAFDQVSLDRMDPGDGYVPGNVILCCYGINRMKYMMLPDEFRNWCMVIWNYHQAKTTRRVHPVL